MSKVEPSHEMRQAAMACFEAYQAMVDAGFTEEQALRIVAHMVTGQSGA